MRILIVPSWYFPAGSDTLTGRMFHHHAALLRGAGQDSGIWYPDFSTAPWPFPQQSYAVEEGVPTWRTRGFTLPRWTPVLAERWVRYAGRRLVRHLEHAGRPDILHAQSFLAATICASAWRTLRIPFIYTERSSAWMTRTLPVSLMPPIHKAFRDAAAVTSVSHGLRDRMAIQTTRPITIIPPHVDDRVFFPGDAEEKADRFTLVTAGEPMDIKGLDILLEAFADFVRRHPGLRPRLVYTDQIAGERILRNRAVRLGIDGDVEFTGKLSQSDLAVLFRKSHVYVSASRVETFGKAMAEAQACGLPIVATPTDGAKDILAEAHHGVLANGFGIEALGNALSAIAERYTPGISGSIASAAQRFHRASILLQWMSLYRDVAG